MGKSAQKNRKYSLCRCQMHQNAQAKHNPEHGINLIQNKENELDPSPFVSLLRCGNRKPPFDKAIGQFEEHIQKAEKHANQEIKGRCIFKIQVQKTPLILS